ncbi:MAG: hypothetical protein HC836_03830 [Richelia sp. RM2_1_2]|nr:hypothetical protein [Richelia sp. RM1_1_1]NJO57536.1 hypothetical protein [Richelia sp. RM2_1_2]
MNILSVQVVIFGLGAMTYIPKVDATIALSPKQLFTTPVQAEIFSLLTEVDSGISAIATSGWKKFYSNEGNFSIFVPDTSVTNLNSQSEDYSINIYYADTKKSSYIVGYIDYKVDLNKLPLSEVYDNFLKEFLGNEVKLLKQQNIQLGKYSGIEAEYQNENQEIIASIRLFLVGKRLYVLDVSNSKSGDAMQFFNSFKLENNIKDNPTKIAII